MTLQALIFDVDGTLADTEEAHRLAFNASFQDFGYDWTWDRGLYKSLLKVTGGRARIRHYLSQRHPDMLEKPGLDDRIVEIHKHKTRLYGETLAGGGVPLRPGVERLIGEARSSGVALALATTTTRSNVGALLSGTAVPTDWFEVMGTGEWVENLKPAPDIYVRVMEKLGLGPGECLAFEDSENGLRAALGAGLGVIVTPVSYTEDGDFSGARCVFSDLGEPDRPFKVLAGDSHGRTLVDVGFLRILGN